MALEGMPRAVGPGTTSNRGPHSCTSRATDFWMVLLAVSMMPHWAQATPGAESAKAPESRTAFPRIKVNDGSLEVSAVPDLAQDPLGPRLGNGAVATPSDWPASAVAKSCTATLIGPQVLLTAAHCVGNGSTVTVRNAGLPDFTGVCTRHSKWSLQNLSPDVALCLMAPMARTGLFFESIQLDSTHVASGKRLILGGYGCTDLDKQEDEIPPLFRIGPAVVAIAPGGSATWPQWLTTQPAKTGSLSFACPGDSGGAAYRIPAAGIRGVVGVISAVNDDKLAADYKATYIAALASNEIRNFIQKWVADTATKTVDNKPVRICGVDLFDLPCRPAPP